MQYHYTIFDMRVKNIPGVDDTKEWMLEACDVAKITFPSPIPGSHAYTVVAVLTASHVAIHTAPEDEWVEVAFACCRELPKGELLETIERFFKPEAVRVSSFTGSVPKDDVI